LAGLTLENRPATVAALSKLGGLKISPPPLMSHWSQLSDSNRRPTVYKTVISFYDIS